MDQKLRKCSSDKVRVVKLLRDDNSHHLVCKDPNSQSHILKNFILYNTYSWNFKRVLGGLLSGEPLRKFLPAPFLVGVIS